MPDAHWGYGFCIGGVAAFDPDKGGIVSGGGVGFDIACGVRTLHTAINEKDLAKVRDSLAEALFINGEMEKAITELGEALMINPNYYPSRYLLARIYDEQGVIHKARAEMEKYLMIMDGCDEGIAKVEEIKKRLAEIEKAM